MKTISGSFFLNISLAGFVLFLRGGRKEANISNAFTLKCVHHTQKRRRKREDSVVIIIYISDKDASFRKEIKQNKKREKQRIFYGGRQGGRGEKVSRIEEKVTITECTE